MRTLIKNDSDNRRANRWLSVCIILHNMLLSFDDWEARAEGDENSEEGEEPAVDVGMDQGDPGTSGDRQAVDKRKRLLRIVLGEE